MGKRCNKLKKYPLNQCVLYKCRSMKRLASIFGTSCTELRYIIRTMTYKSFSVPKKDSDELRTISNPNYSLKMAQRRLLSLLQRVQRPVWLISGEKGKCHIDNARYHLENSYCLTLDIKAFYDSCIRDYVYRFFTEKMLCAPDVANYLTDLCTFDKGIKTGTPTSQLIAYYAYEDMFWQLQILAKEYGLKFSLYVDDMTFSKPSFFSYKAFLYRIRGILLRYGHDVKKSKVKFYSKNDAKFVTGVIITSDHQLVAPYALKAKVRRTRKQLSSKPEDSKKLANRLLGYISAIKQIEPNLFGQTQSMAKRIVKSN